MKKNDYRMSGREDNKADGLKAKTGSGCGHPRSQLLRMWTSALPDIRAPGSENLERDQCHIVVSVGTGGEFLNVSN